MSIHNNLINESILSVSPPLPALPSAIALFEVSNVKITFNGGDGGSYVTYLFCWVSYGKDYEVLQARFLAKILP